MHTCLYLSILCRPFRCKHVKSSILLLNVLEAFQLLIRIIENSAGRQTPGKSVSDHVNLPEMENDRTSDRISIIIFECVNRLPYRLSMALPLGLGRLVLSSLGVMETTLLSSNSVLSLTKNNLDKDRQRFELWTTCSAILTKMLSNDAAAVCTLHKIIALF